MLKTIFFLGIIAVLWVMELYPLSILAVLLALFLWARKSKDDKANFFGFCAFITSLIVLFLEFSPYLVVSSVSGGFDSDGKIYFYVKNTGQVPAYPIKGRFIITSNSEKVSQKAENGFKLKSGVIDPKQSVIFYPTGEKQEIPLVYTVELKNIEAALNKLESSVKREHTFISIYFKYPPFSVIPLYIKKYEGVFQYDDSRQCWVTSSQTLYPDFFAHIFKALRKNKDPIFPYDPLGANLKGK